VLDLLGVQWFYNIEVGMEKKLVLVTGASRGIGQAIFQTLAQVPELIVAGTATSETGVSSIREICKLQGLEGSAHLLDVNDDQAVGELLASLLELYQKSPTILVNNAGITQDNLSLRMHQSEWQSVIDTNLTAVFNLCQQVMRGMLKQRWGRMINIGSVVGSTGNPGQANYAAAKAGLLGLSRSLALELASRNVTVNVISPGFIETDMTQGLSEVQRQSILERVPLGRMGTGSEVAALVRFLVSDSAAYMTGCNLHINGGMFMG
jgi:3-oxoacyl-[acyl-carrier protein] reductase